MGACGGITTTKTAPVTLSERPFCRESKGPYSTHISEVEYEHQPLGAPS